MHVKDIALPDVLRVIEKEWSTKAETMRRVRQRIEATLAWAGVMGYRDKQNPAVWRNNLDQVLAQRSKATEPQKHPALKTKDVRGFIQALSAVEGEGAKCLYFAMLTACRSGEARGATWSQEFTNYPSELREHALAHSVGGHTTQSYERGSQFEKRRALMQDWANFCHASATAANVTDIRAA